MGKRKKIEDSLKGKEGVVFKDDPEVFEGDSICQLQMENAPTGNGLDYCIYCDIQVPVHVKNLKDHYECSSHLNNVTVARLLPRLRRYGVDWLPEGKLLYCSDCGVILDSRSKTLIQHVEKHGGFSQAVTMGGEDDFGNVCSMTNIFKSRQWKVDLKSTNVGLNLQMSCYRRLTGPFIIRDDSPGKSFLASLRNDVFSRADLAIIGRVASFLYLVGNQVNRSKATESSKMKAFGMRWARGDTGW